MIEVTDEMIERAGRALFGERPLNPVRRSHLGDVVAAVLAIVERDYRVEPRPPWDPPWRCAKCGSRLQACAEAECVDPAQCGDVWCAHHTPDGAW
jgi:hypothetical protein